MSWTYTNNPANVTLDALRFAIGDTDTSDKQLTDEELNYLLTEHTTTLSAAVAAVQSLIAKYSRFVSKSVGDLQISYGQRITNYEILLRTLRQRTALTLAPPFAGGISIADKKSTEDDTDRTVPHFHIGMHDNPGT
jgi:hypothetical protein